MKTHERDKERDIEAFATWLEAELEIRHWRPADLASRSGVYQASLSKILSRERGVGPEVATGIAKALGYPPDVVFRAAGILPAIPEEYPADEEQSDPFSIQATWMTDIMKGMTYDERQLIIDLALFLYRRTERPTPEPPKPTAGQIDRMVVEVDEDALAMIANDMARLYFKKLGKPIPSR